MLSIMLLFKRVIINRSKIPMLRIALPMVGFDFENVTP